MRLRATLHEALSAEDGLATFRLGARLERNLAGRAALSAHGVVHFARRHAVVLALVATVLAALGSAQVLRSVELLFTGGERKLGAAIAAGQLLVGATRGPRILIRHIPDRKKE